jgi:hypothetical protein
MVGVHSDGLRWARDIGFQNGYTPGAIDAHPFEEHARWVESVADLCRIRI